jgi:type VI secretion system ImpA family protein
MSEQAVPLMMDWDKVLTTMVADWDKVLAPMAGQCPTGESLRYEGTYDRIEEARRADDPGPPQGIWKTALKKADWQTVQALCLEALTTRSKDLQIAVWLLEAWLHLYGLAGVREGMYLVSELCERFWDDLHPQIKDDDVEYRIAPFEWLNEKLAIALKQLPMTQPDTEDIPAYTWADWESATHLDYVASKDHTIMQEAEATGKVTQARFSDSAMLSPKAFYVALWEDLQHAMEATVACESVLQEHLGSRAPSLWQFKEVLGAMQHLVHDILAERPEEAVYSATAVTTALPDMSDDVLEHERERSFGGGPIRSRSEAYRRLLEAAEYLLRTEPHSPTPYLVKRAVAWGNMTLVDLLQELVANEHDRKAIYGLLGVKERR